MNYTIAGMNARYKTPDQRRAGQHCSGHTCRVTSKLDAHSLRQQFEESNRDNRPIVTFSMVDDLEEPKTGQISTNTFPIMGFDEGGIDGPGWHFMLDTYEPATLCPHLTIHFPDPDKPDATVRISKDWGP